MSLSMRMVSISLFIKTYLSHHANVRQYIYLRLDWLPPCTPLMTLIMMDITMAKRSRSIMYDTNETYDSSKVVEVSRAVRWHERNTLVSTSYGCSVPRGGYHTLFMTFVNDLEQKMAWVSYENLEISSMGAQN